MDMIQLSKDIKFFDENSSIAWQNDQNQKAYKYLEGILSLIESKKLPANLKYYQKYFTDILSLSEESPKKLTFIMGGQINPHLVKFVKGLKEIFKTTSQEPFLVLFHRANRLCRKSR